MKGEDILGRDLTSLKKLEFISDLNRITTEGIKFFNQFIKSYEQELKVVVLKDNPFQEWWDAYPSSDKHAHYPPSRSLRSYKDKCRQIYEQLLIQGELSHAQLLSALKKEVHTRKLSSLGENRMTFMKNSFSYLESEDFHAWLDEESASQNSNSPKFNQNLL